MNLAKLKSLVKYVAFNALYAYSIYAGVILHSDGWANIAKFMTIVAFITGLMLFTTKNEAKVLESYLKSTENNIKIPAFIDVPFDLAIIGVFLFNGWIVYGTLAFLTLIFLTVFKSNAKEYVFEALKS